MSWLIDPFADFAFMQRALLGCLAISLGATPVGVFLLLRRMSLTAMPWRTPSCRAAVVICGRLNLGAMTLGGVAAGLVVAVLPGRRAVHRPARGCLACRLLPDLARFGRAPVSLRARTSI